MKSISKRKVEFIGVITILSLSSCQNILIPSDSLRHLYLQKQLGTLSSQIISFSRDSARSSLIKVASLNKARQDVNLLSSLAGAPHPENQVMGSLTDLPSGPCVTYSGNFYDNDGDGILNSITENYDCTYQSSEGQIHMTGQVIKNDDNDQNNQSGFYGSYNNLVFQVIGSDKNWGLSGSIDLNVISSGNYTGFFKTRSTYKFDPAQTSNQDISYATMNTQSPFSEGQLSINGTVNAYLDSSKSLQSASITSNDLIITDSCGNQSNIESGIITMRAITGGFSTTDVYQNCGVTQ